jgi:DNA-binding LacI/PurR family transcriptional regulator
VSSSKVATSPPHDYKNVLSLLAKGDFDQGVAVERQVAAHVKTLIETGRLAPGVRLPPIRILAELWDTNYFTVQAALRRVFADGLLIQSPKLGTFVAGGDRVFRRVCLYHDHDLSFSARDEFYSKLNIWLYRLLAERGIQITTYFDHRAAKEMGTVPKDIRDLARDRQIDAIIASAMLPANSAWLTKLGIPYASHRLDPKHGGILVDYEGFAKQAVAQIVRAGRKHVGLILPELLRDQDKRVRPSLAGWIEKTAREAGLKLTNPDPIKATGKNGSLEEEGHDQCEALLSGKDRPDALIFYPDTYTRGGVSALLKHRVQVPRDMTVVSHRNADSAIFTPFPVIWLTVKIEDFALALIKQINNQFAGKKPEPAIIRSRVETNSETPAPTRRRKQKVK